MSTINTNGIDVNYPIPGQNNSTQGFRNNFTAIRQNLNIAGNEISDLQNKVVLKSALANSTLNNDMANTLIANASTLQFRATTYNLGNALVDNVLIDCTLGDVQYGNLAGNIVLDFGSWIPTNTQGGIELQLGRPNADVNYSIFFPSEAVFENRFGWPLIENSDFVNNVNTLTFPNDLTQINLKLYSTDCGNSIFVQPINRPFRSTQIQQGTPPSTGQLGDTVGTIYVDPGTVQLTITGSNRFGTSGENSFFTTSDTTTLYSGLPVTVTGISLEANVVVGNTYYIRNVVSNTTFTLSSSIGGSNIVAAANVANANSGMLLNSVQYMYVAVQDFNANFNQNPLNVLSTTAPNVITLGGNTYVANNQPIIFYGTDANLSNVGLQSNTVYYIKETGSNNTIKLSQFRYNGVAGLEYQGILDQANANVDCRTFQGSDIFRRIPLQPF